MPEVKVSHRNKGPHPRDYMPVRKIQPSGKTQTQLSRDLLALGIKIEKSLRESDPEALDRLDEYTDAFDAWHRSWADRAGSFSGREREIGERIAEQHATVLKLTEGMLRSVEQSLKELRGWSKGIRAYMDHFPKQVSTMRTRKG